MKFELEVYRKGNKYYVDDPSNGYSEDDNELITDIPRLFEDILGKVDRIKVSVNTEYFEGAMQLKLLNPDVGGGVDYGLLHNLKWYSIWLCKVTFHYIPKNAIPKLLYVKVQEIKTK
jgi:hypothetical protein